MKLTTLEILEANRGLPVLVQRLLQMGEVRRALEIGATVRRLKPEVEVFEINRQALARAYGDDDPRRTQALVKAGTEQFVQYEAAMRELLNREVELNVAPIAVTAEELQGLAADALVAVGALVALAEDR